MDLFKTKFSKFFLLILLTTSSIVLCQKQIYEIKPQGENSDIYSSLKYNGFCEIGNYNFLKKDYNEIYKNFDTFINIVNKNDKLSTRLYNFEKEFLSINALKKRYCAAPPSYRNPKEHLTKRFNKIYFQFIEEYFDFIQKKDVRLFIENAEIFAFFNSMKKLDTMARELFKKIIDALEESRPGIKALVYGNHNELSIISKIVRYEKTEGWGTTPHRDKSFITLIWDSNDENDDSLLLCEDTQRPSFRTLRQPQRRFSQKNNVTSTLLIPGAACSKVGVDLNPTIHGVAPIKNDSRHAVISFLLIPDIDMSDIIADFTEPAGL